jgi:hypothetical protein
MALVDHTHTKGGLSFPITGQTSHAAGDTGTVGHIVNPEDGTIVVTACYAYISANSTGACDLTVGTGASATAAHDATDLFAAAAMAAAVGTAVTGFANGDAADALPVIAADEVIAAYCSADSSGLAGRVFIEYVRV